MNVKAKAVRIVVFLALAVILLNICLSATTPRMYIYYANQAPQYNYTNLDKLFFTMPVTTEPPPAWYNDSWYDRIYQKGCVVTCYAMMLANANKITPQKHFDIRDGVTHYLVADPFTVAYANTNFATITPNGDGTYTSAYVGDPVLTYPYRIAQNFGATYMEVKLENLSLEEKMCAITYFIELYPQGVGIFFSNSSGTHMVIGTHSTLTYSEQYTQSVLAKLSYPNLIGVDPLCIADPIMTEEQVSELSLSIEAFGLSTNARLSSVAYGDDIIVCDTINYTNTPGNNVKYNKTWSATTFAFDDAISLRIMY